MEKLKVPNAALQAEKGAAPDRPATSSQTPHCIPE
jgi:hypothetical protein